MRAKMAVGLFVVGDASRVGGGVTCGQAAPAKDLTARERAALSSSPLSSNELGL